MAIKVMVVDDSNFMRKAIASLLSSDHRIEVASMVGSGEDAIDNLATVKPDVITLDFNLPGMDGISTLKKIMKMRPTPVIMFSGHTKQGAEVTLNALKEGAIDFVAKPHGSLSLDLSKVQDELIKKVIAAASSRASLAKKSIKKEFKESVKKIDKFPCPEKSILFIGSSTGGVQALTKVVPHLPADFPMPVLVVQHMPPIFTKSLASSLNDCSSLIVKEAEDGDVLKAGTVLIAPGGWHAKIVRKINGMRIKLDKEPSDTLLRPCADVSMNAVAAVYGGDSAGVILTGMGNDGTEGAVAMKKKGARIIAQDEATSTVFGMPRSVIEAGVADAVLPIDKIAGHIASLI